MTAKPKPQPKWPDAEELFGMLEDRYQLPSWALLPQVANSTGGGSRYADAVAMSCWPSLGMRIHGFEIKTYRGDWLKEIRNGGKSQPIFQYCDHWWIVVSHEGIVKEGDLPPTWGLLAPKGKQLRVVVNAPELKPKDPSRTFVASVLRNAVKVVTPRARLDRQYKDGYAAGKKEADEVRKWSTKNMQADYRALQEAVAVFEKAAGVRFPHVSEWTKDFKDHAQMGEAVRLVLAGDYMKGRKELLSIRETAEDLIRKVNEGLEKAQKPEAVPK